MGASSPNVLILMAVHNGAAYLPEQLASIATQSHQDWTLLVSDDGSTDGSTDILNDFAATHPVHLVAGPQQGATQNFLHLLRASQDYRKTTDLIAFADQDDVWFADKLARAVSTLRDVPSDSPTLYCSNSWVVDSALRKQRIMFKSAPRAGFRNALVENIAQGNTIVLNPAGASLMCQAAQMVDQTSTHDWLTYQVISGAGGQVAYDHRPSLLYRQHGGNQIGSPSGLAMLRDRLRRVGNQSVRRRTTLNLAALRACEALLAGPNRTTVEQLDRYRSANFLKRLTGFFPLGLYRQRRIGTVLLYVLALLRRV